MSKTSAPEFSSFKEAYDTLRSTAAELRAQEEPDIDHLATKVERAVAAYRVCETRINAVEKALEGVFAREDVKEAVRTTPADAGEGDVLAEPQASKGPDDKPAGKKGGKFDDFEDDIPF